MKKLNFSVNVSVGIFFLIIFLLFAFFCFYIGRSILAIIFVIGILCGVYCILFPPDELTKIEHNNKELLFYYCTQKKRFVKKYDFTNIEVFNITIKSILKYEFSSHSEPIDLIFTIKMFNEEPCVYKETVSGQYSIKDIFEFAKDIPNFSYNVETNSDVMQANIHNIAETGKEISLNKAINIIKNDSNVPQDIKTILVLGFIYCIIALAIVIPMIISIIKDFLQN